MYIWWEERNLQVPPCLKGRELGPGVKVLPFVLWM